MKLTTLTMNQYQTIQRALALAHEVTKKRDEPDRLAANAMEAADYRNLYKLLRDNPIITVAPAKARG